MYLDDLAAMNRMCSYPGWDHLLVMQELRHKAQADRHQPFPVSFRLELQQR
jgi:hypothetical protein